MADAVASKSPGPSSVRPHWRVLIATTCVILLVVVVRNVVVSSVGVLGWAIASIVAAALLSPLVSIADRVLPRALAFILVFLAVAAVGVGARSLYVTQLQEQVDFLAEHAPDIASGIEDRDDRVGEVAREIGLVDRVGELTERLQENLGTPSDALVDAARAVPAYLVCFILTIFFMIYGPRIVEGGLKRVPDDRRDRMAGILRGAVRSTQLQAGAAVIGAVVVGLVIWVVGLILDVPSAGLFALFGAVMSAVPYLGILVGWLPVVIVGIGVAPLWEVGLVALVAIALQYVEATRWRPLIDGRSLYVGPAFPIVGAVLGYAIYGVGGMIVTVTLLIFGLAMADEAATDDADGDGDVDAIPTPIDDFVEAD